MFEVYLVKSTSFTAFTLKSVSDQAMKIIEDIGSFTPSYPPYKEVRWLSDILNNTLRLGSLDLCFPIQGKEVIILQPEDKLVAYPEKYNIGFLV